MLTRTLGLALTLGLAGLAGYASAATHTVDVDLSSYAMKLNPDKIQAGETTFVVKNDATDTRHEFILVKTDLAPNKLPTDKMNKVNEESKAFTEVGSAEDIDPGKTKQFTANLTPGHYDYFCNISEHYAMGMRGEFTVTN